MYVMISFRFGNPSCLTHASHSLSQPSHLLDWCSCTCAFANWSRARESEGRLLERFSSQVRFYRLVSTNGLPSRSYQVSNGDRFLFMGGTSCIIVGFSFAGSHGCESRYLSLLPTIPIMPVSRDSTADAYVDHRRHWIVNFSWRL